MPRTKALTAAAQEDEVGYTSYNRVETPTEADPVNGASQSAAAGPSVTERPSRRQKHKAKDVTVGADAPSSGFLSALKQGEAGATAKQQVKAEAAGSADAQAGSAAVATTRSVPRPRSTSPSAADKEADGSASPSLQPTPSAEAAQDDVAVPGESEGLLGELLDLDEIPVETDDEASEVEKVRW